MTLIPIYTKFPVKYHLHHDMLVAAITLFYGGYLAITSSVQGCTERRCPRHPVGTIASIAWKPNLTHSHAQIKPKLPFITAYTSLGSCSSPAWWSRRQLLCRRRQERNRHVGPWPIPPPPWPPPWARAVAPNWIPVLTVCVMSTYCPQVPMSSRTRWLLPAFLLVLQARPCLHHPSVVGVGSSNWFIQRSPVNRGDSVRLWMTWTPPVVNAKH